MIPISMARSRTFTGLFPFPVQACDVIEITSLTSALYFVNIGQHFRDRLE